MPFNYGSDNHDLLWDIVSGSHETQQKQAGLVHAKVAASQYWPFLSRAVSESDFENRLSLTESRIAALVPAELLDEVLSSLRDDYRLVTAKGENPFAKDDDDDDDEADNDDKDSKDPDDDSDDDDDDSDENKDDDSKSDDNDDDDDDDSDDNKPAFLKGKDADENKKTAASERLGPINFGDDPNKVCGQLQAMDSHYHTPNNSPLHHDQRCPVHSSDPRYKTATNYQPDPNKDWRYHPGYEQLRQPVNNGPLQDADGFVKDLAEGEGRSNPVMEERQLTPGVWTQHDGMPERPMPFSQQRGYMPVNASYHFDAQGFVVEANQYIKQQGGQWVILQKGTGKVLSHHDSQEEAQKSFEAMEAHKHGARDDSVKTCPRCGDELDSVEGRTHCPTCEPGGPDRRKGPGVGFGRASSRRPRFDAQGFVIESAEGRGVDPLQDPVPGQPQRHNPFYFQQGSGMGQNNGFPTDPSAEPHPNNLDELYGEVAPQQSSGSSMGQVDGDGYSRLNTQASRLGFNRAAVTYGPEPGRHETVACPRCGGMGGEPGSNFGDHGWHPCYHCDATGKVNAHSEWEGREYGRGVDHGEAGHAPEEGANEHYLQGYHEGYEREKYRHYPSHYQVQRDGEPTYYSPAEQDFRARDEDWSDEFPTPHRQASLRFDAEGFLVESPNFT